MLGLVAANLGVSPVSQSMQRLRRAGVKFVALDELGIRLIPPALDQGRGLAADLPEKGSSTPTKG